MLSGRLHELTLSNLKGLSNDLKSDPINYVKVSFYIRSERKSLLAD